MKRSILEVEINNWLNTADEITGATILDYLEQKGMQPPFTGILKQENIADRWSQDKGFTEIRRVLINQWEPEDGE